MSGGEMSSGRFAALAVFGLWLAAGWHVATALRSAGSPWTPHVALALACVLSLWTSRRVALGLGFAVGLLDTTMAGTGAFAYGLTRMAACLLAASVGGTISDRGAATGGATAAGAALLSNLVLLFLVAPRGIGFHLLAALLGAVTTGLVGAGWAWAVARLSGMRSSGAWGG